MMKQGTTTSNLLKHLGTTLSNVPRKLQSTSCAIVNLRNITENVENTVNFAKNYNQDIHVMPVVKANAYGHGDTPVVRELYNELSIKQFAVNRVKEGVKIRSNLSKENANIEILVLGYAIPEEVKECVTYNLTPTISGSRLIVETLFRECEKQDKTINVHLKVDTGMGRFGAHPEKLENFLRWFTINPMKLYNRIKITGVFTHFSSADEMSPDYTREQFYKFMEVKKMIENHQVSRVFEKPLTYHCCNSAGTLFFPEMHMDMIRPGISIYGLSPSNDRDDPRLPFKLKPALTVVSHLGRVQKFPKGSPVSYGNTYTVAEDDETLALVPVGYGDGYKRINTGKAHVLIRGEECPIVGRICMDQFVVKISPTVVDRVKINDEVVLIGEQDGKEVTCEMVSHWSNTINYEVVTALLPRLKRVYVK
ncbi:tentative alanine racemase [Naegleria gruberi]|uniref:Tentative alanine racemase n=1 Tax=Naegleria gruberi TaxID=5762 RepID=D2VRE6_NAEGR|nr:tentative alanine racemase [Naegleria gruberi]EFC40656.1 tentative alanine racemase [Naegleria gruberi]|eukprot:XP_002673400.1 tentative alanine racemase [Naegleria gruberi strain NEG-M]